MKNFNSYGNAHAVASVVAFSPASTTATLYGLSLMHMLCDNRRVCINSAFSPTASLNYTVGTIKAVGNDVYAVEVFMSGSLTYLPHRAVPSGCTPCGNICPVSEPIYSKVIVYVYSTTVPTIAVSGSGTIVVNPANVADCCTITNAVQLLTEFTLTLTPATEG